MMNKKRIVSIVVFLGCVLGVISVQAVVSIGPDVIVKGTTIEVVGPGPDLQDIIDGITIGANEQYLIKLGPGEYTIEPDAMTFEGLKMAPFISIMGSGQGVTILKGAIGGTIGATSAIVSGANNAALTDLSVENTALGGAWAIAIFNASASPRIERVTATASGASTNVGVYNSISSPTMTNVTAKASGAATSNTGVWNLSSSSTMTHVTAEASGTATDNTGVQNGTSSSTMSHVIATASGGTNNIGLEQTGGANPQIDSSNFSGDTAGITDMGSGARITNTRIVGGITSPTSGTQCRNTFNELLEEVSC